MYGVLPVPVFGEQRSLYSLHEVVKALGHGLLFVLGLAGDDVLSQLVEVLKHRADAMSMCGN